MNTNPTVEAVQLNETAAADPERELVDVLAEVYAQRFRNKEDPAIREYSEMFPEQAGEIWDAFPAVAWLEGALSPFGAAFISESQATMAAGAGDISVAKVISPRTETPDSIGDFRIVREIGRGGMGVVYEAVQQSLGRTVALKVLPPSNLNESQIGRFHREAQSAGRLHHTNIVPVFGVGEHDGMHYYVMQCIQGQGLDNILNSFHEVEGGFVSTNQTTEGNTGSSNTGVKEKSKNGSTTERTVNVGRRRIEIQTYETTRYWQSVAEIGRQVTDALQHAHDQNTLHRDIKPANLLLDVHDTVWITDFGLAKSLEEDAFDITQTGEVLGTPRYMSPEQLRGKAEKRSDLYSFGLTLYEMLSLRPAFDAQDRASLLNQVMYEQPPPLDKVNPRIPQDLVTIIHKAIAKEPERRYQSGALLRDDLERFIEGRPILARRTSSLMRLWLWSKRNPVIAGLSAATFLLVLLSAVIGWKGYADTRREKRKVDVQLDQTRKERGRAEDNLNLALQAFDEVFQQIGGDASLDAGGGKLALSRDMANMMESLLIFYTHFIERNADRKGLELEEIRAHTRMGQLYLRLGQFPEARASLENALILYDELPEEKRPDLFTRDKARLLRRIGTTYMTWFETSQARDLFGRAKLILGRALEKDSENVELLFEFANVCQEFAMLAPPKGMHEPAPEEEEHELPPKPAAAGGKLIPPFKEDALTAQSIFRRLIQESPKHPEYKRSLARSLRNMAEPHLAFWSTLQDMADPVH